MPRAQTSAAGRIVDFFRTSPLETADLILGLCQDEVRARKTKSQQAKARAVHAGQTATANETASVAAAPAGKKKGAKKKAGKKAGQGRRRAAAAAQAQGTTETEQQLPMGEGEPLEEQTEYVEGAGDAGDFDEHAQQ